MLTERKSFETVVRSSLSPPTVGLRVMRFELGLTPSSMSTSSVERVGMVLTAEAKETALDFV